MKILSRSDPEPRTDEPRYPGLVEATDGSFAVVHAETLASEAAGAYPITPSSQMGEGWAQAVASGKTNAHGRRLIFFEPEGEHAAAGVTAGMSMTGLRSANFSSGQGIAYMHESLYAAVGKRLTYVLNVAARAMTKHSLNVHAGHDDYHAVDDTGFFQLFSKDVQEVADLTVIAHRIAELSLTPGISAQDGFLTSHVIEDVRLPEPELIREYLGEPSDVIDSPTPAQRLVFGEKRRRIPELFDLDNPMMFGVVQNQDSYAQGVAAQRPFYFDHVQALADRAFDEYAALTGRRYARAQGYRLDDAEYVLAGQGTVVTNLEAVADHLRKGGLKVGVLNLTMFRPFPADLVVGMLGSRKAVTVFERLDQPLAVDPPVLREIRAALYKGLENGRAQNGNRRRRFPLGDAEGEGRTAPYPGVPGLHPDEMPDLYSAGFGFGSRDLQPGDVIAAVENMREDGRHQRQFYLGIEFINREVRYPKLEIWQQELLREYPHLETLALPPARNVNLLPEGTVSLRIHSVGGWGAITMGKNVALTAFELLGLHVKANPKYGSEKKGQPTTFYATLSPDPVKLNSELKHIDVALSPDPNVFRNSDPLAGLAEGGAFVIQSDQDPGALWASFPASARRQMAEKKIRVYALDGFSIASEEATDADLRYRMQGTAFMGAFFKVSGLMERHGLDDEALFGGIGKQLQKKFGHRGERVVQDNLRVIKRGFDELVEVPHGEVGEDAGAEPGPPRMPRELDVPGAEDGLANPGRFWEQVCAFCATSGHDVIADPFAGVAAIPSATSAVRDMTNIRFEVPDFVAEKCTGCSQCWVQCPDAAIPGLVSTVEDVLDTAVRVSANGRPLSRFKQVQKHVAKEARSIMDGVPFSTFGEVLSRAYQNVTEKLGWDPERRKELDEDFAVVYPKIARFPLARTTPFYDLPERREKGSGGLLSITVDPEACKGCNICVEVCPEEALVTVKQDEEIVDELRRNWEFWEALPDTPDRYINISDLDRGIGVLSSLLLKKENYKSMAGGDGACMGCGEKTAVHLLVSTIEGVMRPRVEKLVKRLDELVAGLDSKARAILVEHADLDDPTAFDEADRAELPLEPEQKRELALLTRAMESLKELKWRYEEGPGGRGRAPMGISNSTGCSSVWGSTYPYNPYPFPWVNHLFQDAPSVAIGIFEGHMRKMADNFVSIRRAELLLDDAYDPEVHEPFFEAFDWRRFSDEEFDLCPPILAMGGDGAMLDIGFQNLSRLLASGKPIRVVVLDTQVYSNTGGQACTSGYTGQVADMSAYGKAKQGKEETRKEMGLIGMAHRGAYVLQTSQALASHMIEGIIQGLHSRRPAVFNINTPCPVEHGLADEMAPYAARLALESRAFPFLRYDPDAGDSWAECLSLEGNPEPEARWPTYELSYADEEGEERTMELPLTIADWAATEGRFRKQFRAVPKGEWSDDQVLFHEYVDLTDEEREGKTPFIWVQRGEDRHLERLQVAPPIVELAEDRLLLWSQLRELAGVEVSDVARDRFRRELESEVEEKLSAVRAEYEAKLAELRATYPRIVARRMAEGLLRADGRQTVAELLETARNAPGVEPVGADALARLGDGGGGVAGTAPPVASATVASPTGTAVDAPPEGAGAGAPAPAEARGEAEAGAAPEAAEAEGEDGLRMEPYIDTALCTSCNDCININSKMFAYDENKQAYIADPEAGTYAELVKAAEKCPAAIIHPGDPLDPKEKDLEKWIERAKPFN